MNKRKEHELTKKEECMNMKIFMKSFCQHSCQHSLQMMLNLLKLPAVFTPKLRV